MITANKLTNRSFTSYSYFFFLMVKTLEVYSLSTFKHTAQYY